MSVPPAVASFAKTLRALAPVEPLCHFGEIQLRGRRADIPRLQYNKSAWELFRGAHDYQLTIGNDVVDISVQMYLNTNDHYRLFLYSRCGRASGMLFSINLTTSEDMEGLIWLGQKIAFREGRGKDGALATKIRETKAKMFADMLVRCGIVVTDNFEIEIGTFHGKQAEFLDTTPDNLLRTFITIGLVKGHFAGNKGYQFSCLPRFDDSFEWQWDKSEEVRARLSPNKRGAKGARDIPLALRFNVLERDEGLCRACGRGPADGVKLHVDHITPFSLGGLSTLDNLQTLCADCNLGKGNRSAQDFRRAT